MVPYQNAISSSHVVASLDKVLYDDYTYFLKEQFYKNTRLIFDLNLRTN